MSLTWRDGTALLATVAVVCLAAAGLGGIFVDSATSWRAATLLLVVLGLGIYMVLGPRFLPVKEPWLTITTTLHILAGILAVLSLIIGQKIAFMALAFVLVGLWIAATSYHIHLNVMASRRGRAKQ